MELGFLDVILLLVFSYCLLVISWGLVFHQWSFPLHFFNKPHVSKQQRRKEKDEADRRATYYKELKRLKKQKDALGIIELLKTEDVSHHERHLSHR